MMTTVSVEEKKEFVKWFLQHHALQRREVIWILNYMLTHERLLKQLHFVENAEDYKGKRALIAATTCIKGQPLVYCQNGVSTSDGDKAFAAIRLHHDEPVYVELRFKNRSQCHRYAGICEVNLEREKQSNLPEEEAADAGKFLEFCLRQTEVEKLRERMDCLLDTYGNWTNEEKEEIEHLALRLQELERS